MELDDSPAPHRGEGCDPTLDEAAAVRAAQCDPEAFEPIYRRHLGGVYNYILLRTRNEQDAADLAQQTFAQALASLPRYREHGLPLAAWLYRIARNLVTDYHRRKRDSVPWDLLPDVMQPTYEVDMAGVLIRGEQAEELRAVLTRLEPEKRDLLELRFASGLKIREIAALLGRSEAAVKTELHRTLRWLKENYGGA